jgi:CRISPR-associated protein (TIGR03984 family)
MNNQIWEPVVMDQSFEDAPQAWLAERTSADMPWLLVHADDGVIWGKRQANGSLALSGELFDNPDDYPTVAVALRSVTIQQARLFGPAGELLIWRSDDGFRARHIEDGAQPRDHLDEAYLLWSMGQPKAIDEEAGFALLREGQRGNRHAPPVIPQGRRPRLCVRHYLAYDDQGQAYVCMSRLVKLEV